MATLRNKRKLAAVTRETQEEHPRIGQSRNTSVPRINEEYITQVSEENEGRITKKLSQEFSRTESRILGALSKLDEFLLNQQITAHSGTFQNTNVDNQGTNEDDSQSDPHPEGGLFRSQTTQNSGPEVGPYRKKPRNIKVNLAQGVQFTKERAFDVSDICFLERLVCEQSLFRLHPAFGSLINLEFPRSNPVFLKFL